MLTLAPARLWAVADKPVPYRERKVVRLHRGQERLTLVRFFLHGGCVPADFSALLAVAWWLIPHSWLPQPVGILPVLAVLDALTMAAYGTWPWRQTRHRQASRIS